MRVFDIDGLTRINPTVEELRLVVVRLDQRPVLGAERASTSVVVSLGERVALRPFARALSLV